MFMRRNSIPELEGLNRNQKNQIWRKAYLVAFREPKSWIGLACFAVLYLFGRSIAGMNGGMVGAIIGALVWLQFHTHAARPWCARIRELEYDGKGLAANEDQSES